MRREDPIEQPQEKRPVTYKIGIFLMVISLIIWVTPLVIPFLPLSVKVKTSLITGAIIIAEILFWVGAVLVGKEVATKIRGYVNPKNWRRKRKTEVDPDE